MIKKLQQKLKSKKGFTLIELLIVIAVLGIIAAIAIPRFSGVLGSVKDKADVRSAELFAKEVYAELVVGNITGAGALTAGGTGSVEITDTARSGFKGDVPTSQVDTTKKFTATITNETAGFKIVIKRDTTVLKTLDKLTGPIN